MGATQTDLIASAYFAWSTALTIKAAKVLGEDTTELEALYANVRKAFRDTFMENGMPKLYEKGDALPENRVGQMDRPVKAVTQTAILLILHFGLCEESERAALVDKLVELIRDFGGRMTTGFVGTPLILHVLSDNGHADLAFDLLLQEKNPSWLFSVNQGATTIWEHWDSKNDKGEFWSTDMNSFNHYAYGACAGWFYRNILGIKPTSPAYKTFSISPIPSEELGFAKAVIETRSGVITSEWTYTDDGVRYSFSIPEGTTAEVTIDGVTSTYTPGTYTAWGKR
jgi:alpha-L-rhamnosidase